MIPTDRVARMRPDSLEGAIAYDLGAGRKPLAVIANAGATATGASIRSRAGRDLPPGRRLASRRRRLRCLCRDHRARQGGARGDRARRLDHARSTQVALSARRGGGAARPRRRGASAWVRDLARLPQGGRGGRRRGELLGSRPPADPRLSRAEALDLDPLLRPERVSRRRRPLPRPRAARAGADRVGAGARADVARIARDRDLPPPSRRGRRRDVARTAQCLPGGADRGKRRCLRLHQPCARTLRDPPLHPQPLDVAAPRSTARSSWRSRSRSNCSPPRRPRRGSTIPISRRGGCGGRRSMQTR